MSERCAWGQVIVMVTVPCAVAGDGDCLYQFFFTYFEKENFKKTFFAMTKPYIISVNMFALYLC